MSHIISQYMYTCDGLKNQLESLIEIKIQFHDMQSTYMKEHWK